MLKPVIVGLVLGTAAVGGVIMAPGGVGVGVGGVIQPRVGTRLNAAFKANEAALTAILDVAVSVELAAARSIVPTDFKDIVEAFTLKAEQDILTAPVALILKSDAAFISKLVAPTMVSVPA